MPALKALHSTYGSWPSLIALNRVEVKLYKRKVNIHTIDKINIGVN